MTTYRDLLRGIREPTRIRASDLIPRIVDGFRAIESPDPTLKAGTGTISGLPVFVLGQEKPKTRDAAAAAAVNYGMMRAAGYWFVIEQLTAAASTGHGVVTLIDTPGADPSKAGTEMLLAWAISASISSFIGFPGPSVSVVIGEGGSGGALALQVADRRLMASDALYSVISPESCSAILFRDADHIEEAMQILRPSAPEVLRVGLIDEIVEWPNGVALTDHERAAALLKARLAPALQGAFDIPDFERAERRLAACLRCGRLDRDGIFEPKNGARPGPPASAERTAPKKFVAIDPGNETLSMLQYAYFVDREGAPGNSDSEMLLCPRKWGGCGTVFSPDTFEESGWACPTCGRGERLCSTDWLRLLCDPDSFEEMFSQLELRHLDDAGYDNDAYRQQRERARQKSGVTEALRVGVGQIMGSRCALAVSDFFFMGGTLGAVVGEKLRLIADVARQERLPLVSLTCSGGARMQDGTLGLAQMARTNACIKQLVDAGLPHISILADPCTGGALGSYATCATVVLAEPKALIAFAGPRVMKLAGLPLNERQLVSECFTEYGGIDEVVPRHRLRERIARYLHATTQLGRAIASPAKHQQSNSSAAGRRHPDPGLDVVSRMSSLAKEMQRLVLDSNASSVLRATTVTQLANTALVFVPLLLEQATRSENHRVRANAVEALARFPEMDRNQLFHSLNDSHHRVRANAAVGLLIREPGNPDAVAATHELLRSTDPVVKRSGLFVTIRVPSQSWVDAVENLCREQDPLVRLTAGIAAVACGEIDLGRSVVGPAVHAVGSIGQKTVDHLLPFLNREAADTIRTALAPGKSGP